MTIDAPRYSQPAYCAVVHARCPFPVEQSGDSATLAYPFQAWRKDWASSLRDALRAQGIGSFVPHEQYQSNYLICNVCREIRARKFTIAEATDTNWNVFFEAGLAFGFGKSLVLSESANEAAHRARAVFPEYLRAQYHYVDDVVGAVLAWADEAALYIDRIPAVVDQRSVYFLDPGTKSDIVAALKRTLRLARPFRYVAPVGGVSRVPTMQSLLYDVKAAGAMVGLLLPETYIDQDVVNSQSAFLIGVAVALGKPVLVLLQEPIGAGPADLRMLAHRFGSAATMRRIAKDWLANLAKGVPSTAATITPTGDVRQVDLGNAWAERDPLLDNYFLETASYRRARDAATTVFLGRRGAGKSAIALRLVDPDLQGHGIALRSIRPEDFEMQELQEAYAAVAGNTAKHWRLVLGAIWRYLLLHELAQGYLDYFASRAEKPHELEQLRSLFELVPAGVDFVDAVLAVTEHVRSLSERDLRRFLGGILRPRIYEPFREISRRVPCRLVLDNLDVGWSATHEINRFILASLIKEAERINQTLAPRAAVLLFLRTDIYNIVKLADPDVDKQSRERLQWDREALVELVGLRLRYLLRQDKLTPSESWASVFPRTVEGVASTDFLIGLTIRRPRELLKLCARSVEIAQSRDSRTVTESDILSAYQSYSEEFLTDLHGEFLIELPGLYFFLSEFAGETWPKGIDEMRGLIRRAARREMANGRGATWLADSPAAANQILKKLYEIGVVGLTDGKRRVFSFEMDWPAAYSLTRRIGETTYGRRARREVSLEPSIVLHPGLWPVLGASDLHGPSRYKEWRRRPAGKDAPSLR
jgi:hypothetical protein